MPKISTKNMDYEYDESEIINFTEGLIGLPKMRRAVLIPMNEYLPFCWLASLDDEKNRFVVINPHEVFKDYSPHIPSELSETQLQTLAIVKISSDWEKTTINLRAPIFINIETRKGAQVVLSESKYDLAATLPHDKRP
jgi:flagellar assembly factor FliW